MSVRKYGSLHSLKEAVSLLLDQGGIDQALHLVHDCVERIVTEPLCTAQVFGSKTLDDLCQRIGKVSLMEIKQEIADTASSQRDSPVFVYIVTKLQKSGGHTRVIEDFIKAQPGGQHVILSTELGGRSDTGYLMKGLAKQADIIFEKAPKESYQQRLTWLQKRLLKIAPRRVYLFNHHQDSVAVASIQPEMKLDASFYHHGDHHLCLGVYLSHLEHIDPHPMGYHNCRDELGIDNTYIPLTVDDKGARPDEWPFFQDKTLTTCTAARSNKIEIPYFVSYLELVPKLLRATGGRHVHIGQLTPWALFKIRRGLKRYGIQPDRFIYTSWVPSVWKALHDYRVDLYVASFPYGGGLTLIEAMGAGIPVALHRHTFSRILSGIDLGYSDAFSWRSPDELLNYSASLTAGDLEQAGRLGRLQYEEFHSRGKLQEILNDVHRGAPKHNDLLKKFNIESDEWALWMERQLTIRRVFSRAAYRVVRRFRAWW
jgi:glycosyltransferase involved in cell wall biosynthesis